MSMFDRVFDGPSPALRAVSRYLEAMQGDPFALRGQQLRGGGPVERFEAILCERTGFPFCVATANATSALLCAALALDVGGREVIVPPNSWGGTYGPFEAGGAKLVYASSDDSGNICPASIRTLGSPRTVAVLAVDWKGSRHRSAEVRAACDSLGVLYIEDTSWLPGVLAMLDQPSLADVQIISFGPGKPLSLGEGGALLTRHRRIYETVVALGQHPERTRNEGLDAAIPDHPFLNARIHPLAAVLGCALLPGRDAVATALAARF